MRTLAPLLLLLAACGAKSSSSATFDDAEALRRLPFVIVTSVNASVRVRSGPEGRIVATVRWPGSRRDGAVSFKEAPGDGIVVTVDADLVKGDGAEIDITAPAGIGLRVLGGKGPVDVSGSWSRLIVDTSEGTIAAHVDRADSGELKSHRGSVEFVARGRGPTGEITARSTSGAVSVTLPASWKGQLKFQTQTGTLDVASHGNLQTIWDENKKGTVGRMGPPREKGAPLATVWGVSGSGDVSFRVGE